MTRSVIADFYTWKFNKICRDSDFMQKYAETENIMGGLGLLDNDGLLLQSFYFQEFRKSRTLHNLVIISTGPQGTKLIKMIACVSSKLRIWPILN